MGQNTTIILGYQSSLCGIWRGVEVPLSTWVLRRIASLCIVHCATTLDDVIRSTKFRSFMYDFLVLRSAALEGFDGFLPFSLFAFLFFFSLCTTSYTHSRYGD